MNKHCFGTRRLCVWMYFLLVLMLAACSGDPGKEIAAMKPYADFIGTRYSVVGENLDAYGVYESRTSQKIRYITLIPMRVGGSEFAFRRNVPKGTVIRILGARRRFPLMERSVYYLVAVENWDLPQGIPIELQLDRGNEGVGGDLNESVYKRIPKDQ